MTGTQIVMSGATMGESPRWHNGRLWFCDWGVQQVIAVAPDGTHEVIGGMPPNPWSIDWLPDGRMLIVGSSDGRLARQEPNGALATHADLSTVAAARWNEIVVDGRGNTYVNNIGFDLMTGEPPVPGIVAMVAPDGSARQVADDVFFPNGMVVTPDNSTLIVAESYRQRLTAFDIDDRGDLSNRRVWADLGVGTPDGICIDAQGAVWYADVPNQRCVRVREGGEVLQTVDVDRGCFACMLGGERRTTLYIVATVWQGGATFTDPARNGQVLSIEVSVPGAGWP